MADNEAEPRAAAPTDGTRNALSDEDKERIRQQVEFERRLRLDLDPSKGRSFWDWLNSGFVLLVITSLVTAVAVPVYQSWGENKKWKRQTRAENALYRLNRERECLETFDLLDADAWEATTFYQKSQTLSQPTVANITALSDKILALNDSRAKTFAKAKSLLIFMPDRGRLNAALAGYDTACATYLDDLHRFLSVYAQEVSEKDPQTRQALARRRANLETIINGNHTVNELSSTVQRLLAQAISEQEKTYENLDY